MVKIREGKKNLTQMVDKRIKYLILPCVQCKSVAFLRHN